MRAIALPNRAAAFKSLYRKRLLQRGVNPLCSRRLRYNTLISDYLSVDKRYVVRFGRL